MNSVSPRGPAPTTRLRRPPLRVSNPILLQPRHSGFRCQRPQVIDHFVVDRDAEAEAVLFLRVLDLAGGVDPLDAFLAAALAQEAEVQVHLAAEFEGVPEA